MPLTPPLISLTLILHYEDLAQCRFSYNRQRERFCAKSLLKIHTLQKKNYEYAIHSALDMDQGTCIPGKIQLSTLDIMMLTYNSANLNKLHPKMEGMQVIC